MKLLKAFIYAVPFRQIVQPLYCYSSPSKLYNEDKSLRLFINYDSFVNELVLKPYLTIMNLI